MREIKFRVWNILLKKFLGKSHIDRIYTHINDAIYYFNSDNNILSQYTGQKDQNGVEIYEGDIVKQTYITGIDPISDATRLGEVFWCGDEAGFAIAWGDSCFQYNSFQWSSYNVVGNIYNDPDCRIIKEAD